MDETEIGVWSIDLVSEKVKCAEDFQFAGERWAADQIGRNL